MKSHKIRRTIIFVIHSINPHTFGCGWVSPARGRKLSFKKMEEWIWNKYLTFSDFPGGKGSIVERRMGSAFGFQPDVWALIEQACEPILPSSSFARWPILQQWSFHWRLDANCPYNNLYLLRRSFKHESLSHKTYVNRFAVNKENFNQFWLALTVQGFVFPSPEKVWWSFQDWKCWRRKI